ncbi:MAG: prepilin-type N-terminal cleavage/methylation domain-containing protein [Patescibacteria group bacterium]
MKENKISSGFTLVEVLVAISIIAIIGVLIISVLTLSLRGSNKAEVSSVVKQQGNTVLTQIARKLRYAKTLDNPASCVPSTTVASLTITDVSNTQTTYACTSGSITVLSANGVPLIDTNAVAMSNCSFVCSQQTLLDPPTVRIQFLLTAKSTSQLAETQSSLPFQTSITLRNYNR